MSREKLASSNTQNSSLLKVQILVVDDDSTSLSIVSTMLKTCSYKDHRMLELSVVTIKNPLDALATLRLQKGVFDLVLTDLHMPQMNGMELQQRVDEEFKLPVIIMSSDDSENVILSSLRGGAVFYVLKPLNRHDLNSVWQYAVATKTGSSLTIKEIRDTDKEEPSSSTSNDKISFEDVNSATSVIEEKCSKKDGKRRGKKRQREDQEQDDEEVAPKKAKVVWTNSLHNRFLQAINHIGLEKAVPKKILEFMSVPGLSRENVASHLQKYRIFLKRVAERGASPTKNCLSERALRSTFASGNPSLRLNNVRRDYYSQVSGQQQQAARTSSYQPGFGGNTISALGGSGFSPIRLPSQQAPINRNYSAPQFASYGSSRPSVNPTGHQQSMFGNTNPRNQQNRDRLGHETNNDGTNLSSRGGTPYGLMNAPNGLTNGTSSMQMQQQQNQLRSNVQNFGPPSQSRYCCTGIQDPNYGSGIGNMGNVDGSTYPLLYNTNNNYAGIRITSDGQLIGSGKMQHNRSNSELSAGFVDGGHPGSTNWICNDNMNVAPLMGANEASYTNLAQGGRSFFTPIESPNQFGPAQFSGINPANARSMLEPLPQKLPDLANGERNDHAFGLMNNDPCIFDIGISNQQQQLDEGELNVNDMLLESANDQAPYQPQGVVDQGNTPLYEILNPDFFSTLHIDDINAPLNWNEQPSGQLQGGNGGAVNPTLVGNTNSVVDYFPNFEQQQQGSGQFMNSELNGHYPADNIGLAGNQDDDFFESLLRNETLMRE